MTELDQRPSDTVPRDAVSTGPSRRQVLLTGGVVVAAAAVTAACGSSSATSSSTPAAAGSSTPAGTASSVPASSDDSGGGTDVAVADIPVGGGVILADRKVVVTQPAAGEFMGGIIEREDPAPAPGDPQILAAFGVAPVAALRQMIVIVPLMHRTNGG